MLLGDLAEQPFGSVEPDPNAVAPIAGLLTRGCPIAVIRRVRAVIVFSFHRMMRRWRWAQVCQERTVIVTPPPAHNDSSAAVPFKALISRVLAAPLDVRPRPVLLRLKSHFADERAVRSIDRADAHPGRQATTALHFAPLVHANDRRVPAFAVADPANAATVVFSRRLSQRSEPAKLLARQFLVGLY